MIRRVGQKRKCRCGADMLPVIYGFPSDEMFMAAERGEVFLGGCLIYQDAPKFECPECGREKRR